MTPSAHRAFPRHAWAPRGSAPRGSAPRACALLVLLLGLSLTACSDDAPAPLAVPSSSPSPAPALDAGATQDVPDATTSAGTGDPGAPGAPTAPSAPAFPPASDTVDQGAEVWAVYLAVSRLDASGSPEEPAELARAQQQAEAVGYTDEVGGGDIGCDRGALEALRLDPARDYRTASIFFDTQAQAEQFVDAYQPGVVGIARITAFCLD